MNNPVSPLEKVQALTATLRRAGLNPADTVHLGLSYAEAAELLGYSERKVWGLVAAGRLGATREGASVRIRICDITRFQERAKTKLADGW